MTRFTGFAGFRINPQRFVFHALLHLEAPRRLRRIGGLVNVSRHVNLLRRVAFWRLFRLGRFFSSA